MLNRIRPCYNFGSPVFVLTFALLADRLPTTTIIFFTMAPHLPAGELDLITHCLGKNQEPKEIQRVLNAQRQAKRIEIIKIWAIRRACRGVTHQRGRSDGRGKKQVITAAQVDRLNETRKRLLAKAKTEYEVPYHAILKSARLGVHRTTAARHLKSKHGVEWRRIREKPPRSKEHVDERKEANGNNIARD